LLEDEREERLDLLEKLAQQNAIKNLVDENLIEQTGKLLEAQELKEEINQLFENVLAKYNLVTEDNYIDKEIHLDVLIENLKEQLAPSESESSSSDSSSSDSSSSESESESESE